MPVHGGGREDGQAGRLSYLFGSHVAAFLHSSRMEKQDELPDCLIIANGQAGRLSYFFGVMLLWKHG